MKMNNKTMLIAGAIAGAAILSTASFLCLKNISLKNSLAQSEQTVKKFQGDAKRLEDEKKKLSQENDKLQADSISYIGINTQLQSDKEKMQKSSEQLKSDLGKKAEELEKLKVTLEKYEKKVSKEKNEEREKLTKEAEALRKSVKEAEDTLKKERGLYHYNLAVAFTKAQLYDEAIDAYEKSLEFDPNNTDAHYNLGLLLDKEKHNSQKALEHFQKYLELRPDAEDKEEVTTWIEKLKVAGFN